MKRFALFIAGAMLLNLGADAALPSQISGTVRDTNGAPASGVEVKLYPYWGLQAKARTDAEGHFQVQSISSGAGSTPVLVARDPDHNLVAARDLEDGTEVYDLQLVSGAVVSGRVQDEGGKPMTNAVIGVIFRVGNMGYYVDSDKRPKLDAQGHFAVGALPTGRRYRVNVTAKGYGSAESEEQAMDTNQIELAPITLKAANKKIAGVVLYEDKPVKGARVFIYGVGQPNTSVVTDENGHFSKDQMCEGAVNLSVSGSGEDIRATASAQVLAGETNVVLTLTVRSGMMLAEPARVSNLGKPLPDLTQAGISADALQTNKPTLICIFDPEQRPSRRAIRLLGEQNDSLKQKGITVVGLFSTVTTADALKEWKQSNPAPFPVGGVTEKNDKTQWIVTAEKFPWLILTDGQGRVKAEGFELDELDGKLKQQ